MKKNKIIIGLIYTLLFMVLSLVVFMLNKNQYSSYMVMSNDGYAISQNAITKNLFNTKFELDTQEYNTISFSASEIVYEKFGKYYLGDQKIAMNEDYPLFIDNEYAILNMTNTADLVTEDFEYASSYSGLYINDGLSFNPDMERAYREEFILLSLSNGLFINTKTITVSGSFFVEEVLPNNSVIRFMENEIRYYNIEESTFTPYLIEPLASTSEITINGKKYQYFDFLEKLGLYEKGVLLENEKEEEKNPEKVEDPQVIVITPSASIKDEDASQQANHNEQKEPLILLDQNLEEDDIAVPPTPTDSMEITKELEDSDSKDENDKKDRPPFEYDNENQLLKPAKPAELAILAELPDEVLLSEELAQSIEEPPFETEPEEEKEKPVIKDWKKPEAIVGNFITSVYSIQSPGMMIENAEFLYRTGVSFSIYEGSKLVMKKAYGTSSDVSIAPLKPDTAYHVVVEMEYYNKYGLREIEPITKAEVHTKSMSELIPIHFNWTNGQIFYNKLQLANLTITNAISGTIAMDETNSIATYNTYIETVQYLNRIEVIVTSKDYESVRYTFPVTGKDLTSLRTGLQVLYESNGKIASDMEYYYEFICYDRFGNILPLEGVVRGTSHTCKQPPRAEITILKNEVKDIEMSILANNPDEAEIVEGSIYFSIFDRNDNPVITTINRKDKDGNTMVENESSEIHELVAEGNIIKFLDLLDYEVYKIRVFCDYDINDNRGVYEAATIGDMGFTTMPISSLGYAFFDVEIKEIKDNGATVAISLNTSRTDERLVKLLSSINVEFINAETLDSTGIEVTYNQEGEAVVEEPLVVEAPAVELPENNGKISLTTEEIELMKVGVVDIEGEEDVTFLFHVENLESFTQYKLLITPKVIMGTVGNEISRTIDTFYSPDKFTTMKQSPMIDIDAIYASSTFIKLYGVSVIDPDAAVKSYPITIVVYDDTDTQVATFELPSKDKVSLIDVTKLTRDRIYTFRFFAKEYNNGYDMTTYRKNYELFYSELFESKEYLKIATREAVSGSIDLLQLNDNKILNTIEIPAKSITSYTSGISLYKDAALRYYRFTGNKQKAKFSLNVDFGQEQWNSFQIGYSSVNRPTNYQFYLVDPDTNPMVQPFAALTVSDVTRNAESSRWTDIQFFNNDLTLSGVKKIYIVATASSVPGNINYLWGIRFQKMQTSNNGRYYANMHAMVSDPRIELGEIPSYRIKIYQDGVWIDTRRHEWKQNEDGTYTLRMYQIAPDQTETLVDIKEFDGEERICDTDFYYEVEKGFHTYRFELWAIVFDYEIKLGAEEFSTEEEIIGIKTAEDLADIRYGISKKYYVLNDIVFPLGWNNITNSQTFNGELDFRGHTLRYNSTASLITTIGYYGSLKNLVYTFVDGWGHDVERKTDRIVTYNYGSIQNIFVNRNNGNVAQTYKTDSSGICYSNYESGTIENFVVKYSDSLISTNYVGGVCVYNRGMIRNGYIYGEPIKMTAEENITEEQYSSNTYMGGIVAINRQSGIVENVYSLIDIETRPLKSVNDYVFNLIGINDGTLRNSFSAGDVYYGGEIREGYGPAYRNRYAGSTISNTFFYSDKDYGLTNNQEISKLLLYDDTWYNRLFNYSGSTKLGQFRLEPVQMGYYPHVVLPDLMPEQEYIMLPELVEAEQINVIDAYIIEQGEDYAKAVITFDNPDKFEISEIKVRWLDTAIISQDEDGDFYRVTIRLTQSLDTKCYSSYEITSFNYLLGFRGLVRSVEYAQGDEPTVPAEFYKSITSVQEWSTMKDDLQQNYRLFTDLNFQFLDPNISVIPANVTLATSNANFYKDAFSGKLDGNGYKISFVDAGTYGYVIGKLTGTVKNLTIENLDVTKGNGQFKGFIGRMLEGSLVDNVHILGMEAVSYEHCGAIAGDVYAATIVNSSAHNITIRSSADGNYAQYIGGLVGKHRISGSNTIYANIEIRNCYVDGVNLEVFSAGDCGGVGGLIGFIRASAEIYNVYVVNGTIDTVYKNVGGLIGAIDTFTNSESGYYMLKDYYVDVDITSITERCGGIIGFSLVANGELEENGLVLGNTLTSLPDPEEVDRFYGYNKYNYIPSISTIYGYEYSILNGMINNGEGLLTFEELCNPTTYEEGGILNWDNSFVRNELALIQGVMPKLNRVDGTELLPYQNDYALENNPIKVESITSRNYSTGELYVVQITTQHSSDLTITGATFKGLLAADLANPSDAVIITKTETGTILEYVLGIEGYYDAYYLNGLTYNLGEDAGSNSQSMCLSVGITPQYLKIGSVDEWNTLMSQEKYGQKRYNIQITGDLDFTAYHGNAAKDVIVNHIMGTELTTGLWKTIKGIDMESKESFITAAYGNVSYLNFEDITLTKTLSTNPLAVNSYGILSAVTGDINNVNFNNCKVNAYNSAYVGLVALSYGMNYNISLSGVTVYGTYGTVPAKRAVGGLVGRLSGSGGVYDTTAEHMMVQGRDYVGGIVGTQEDGRYLWNIDVENAVVSSTNASYNYIGGIIGYANISSLADKIGDCSIRHSVIIGNIYVGGVVGMGSMMGDSLMTNIEKADYQTMVDQVFVAGAGYSIGGVAGQGVVQRTTVQNSNVYGLYNVAGVTGEGSIAFATCTDSVIGSVYDRKVGDTGNTTFKNSVNNKIAYYQELFNSSTETKEKSVYTEAMKVLGYLTTPARTTAWSASSFTGNNNSKIGGISARALSSSNAIVANCQIGSFGARSVGGIVGVSESSVNSGTYRIISCGTQNCEIYGAEDIGGIAGSHLRAYIESCYSNSNVTATVKNAGGIAGKVKATSLYSISETPYINHVFYGGTVTAPNNVAGIIGSMEQDLYNVNQGWLMVGNVVVTGATGNGNYFINRQLGDVRGITKALVYENSTITFGSISKTANEYYQANPFLLLRDEINFVTTAALKAKTTYSDKLNWSLDTGITSSNYSTRFWNYSGLDNGYMPYITHAPANNYEMASAIRILKYQEGYEPDPENEGKAMLDESGNYVYKYETYDGGVPIPGSSASVVARRMMAIKSISVNIPRAEFYAVDADLLNIEFSSINADATFTVKANGLLVAESKIEKRTFTLSYDFKTELEIIVSDGTEELNYTIWPEDVSRNVMTWNSDYYYTTTNEVTGSHSALPGQFVNLYAGHALDVYGIVSDVETGMQVRTVSGISLVKETLPLYKFDYDGYQISTYKNYTWISSNNRENLRLYVKNNELSAISSSLSMIMDSLIIDDYNGNKYCSVLSTEGMIVDMTDSKLTFPENFDNQDIQYMTSNLYSTNHILLVRYYDGAVAGFNYITGELLDIKSPRGTISELDADIAFTDRSKNVSMTNFATLYMDIIEFKTNMVDIGWAEVNGVNVVGGEAVSSDGSIVNEEASMTLYLEDAYVMDDGTVVGENVENSTAPSLVPSAENTTGATVVSQEGMEPTETDVAPATESLLTGNKGENLSEYIGQAITSDITFIKATIAAVANYGASQSEIVVLEAIIDGLSENSVTITEIKNLQKALQEAVSVSTAKEKKDSTLAGESVSTEKTDLSKETVISEEIKNGSNTDKSNTEETEVDKKKIVENKKNEVLEQQKLVQDKIKKSTKYVAVFETEDSKYVIYDEQELLTEKDEKLESMNEKVERSGHMIDYKAKQRADIKNSGDENIYGFILLSLAIVGIALLLSSLIFKKQKEVTV